MITVTHFQNKIIIEGHANYAPHGQDIVCSAVSTLAQTLIAAVEELTEDGCTAEIEPGKIIMGFRCLSEQTKLLIDAFFVGIKMIADTYPQNVQVQAWNTLKAMVEKEQACIS